MKELLTIITVNFNSSEFVLLQLYCLENLTKNPYKVIIRDNNSKLKDYLRLKKKIITLPNVELYRVENFNLGGSLAHGTALNDLIDRIDTKYGVILDADFTFLYKNWDEILIKQLNNNYPIIGTEGPPSKFRDFPYVYALFFDSDIMHSLDINFLPGEILKNPSEDTGFKIREKFLKFGYKGKLLKYRDTKDFKYGPFRNLNCQEFYLEGYDDIFATHFFRGSTKGKWKFYGTYKAKLKKIPFIGEYLIKIKYVVMILSKIASLKGWFEKYGWIKLCKRIVK